MNIPKYRMKLEERRMMMTAMLDRVGTTEAIAASEGGAERLEQATFVCFACKAGDACLDFLAETDTIEKAPSFCANRDFLNTERLKD